MDRRRRLLRGLLAGSVTTLLALCFHLLGGGDSPEPGVILAAVAAASWLCVMIGSGRLGTRRPGSVRRRLLLLTVGVGSAQLALHWLFAVTTGTGGLVAEAGHGGHAGLGTATLVVPGSAGHAMWWSHAAAGVLTVLALHRGELVLDRLAELTRLAVRRLLRLRLPAARPADPTPMPAAVAPAPLRSRLLDPVLARRGPPVPIV